MQNLRSTPKNIQGPRHTLPHVEISFHLLALICFFFFFSRGSNMATNWKWPTCCHQGYHEVRAAIAVVGPNTVLLFRSSDECAYSQVTASVLETLVFALLIWSIILEVFLRQQMNISSVTELAITTQMPPEKQATKFSSNGPASVGIFFHFFSMFFSDNSLFWKFWFFNGPLKSKLT